VIDASQLELKEMTKLLDEKLEGTKGNLRAHYTVKTPKKAAPTLPRCVHSPFAHKGTS
jgi:hypothetical protein